MEEANVGAVVGATIQVVLQNLLSISKEQTGLVQLFIKDLEKLKSSFDMVHDILYDANMQQVTDLAVKSWMRSLEDVAFDADNVLDEINYQLLSKKVEATQNTSMKKVQSFFSHTKLAAEIRDINKRLEISNQQAIGLGLRTRLAGARAPVFVPDVSASTEIDSLSFDPIILGRENYFSGIVEMLINTSSRAEQVLSVLPIVGMGGLGKTTLAREVFRDRQVISLFGDNRVWVYVSRNFDVRNVLENIMKNNPYSLPKENVELESTEALLQKLKKLLGTARYLLVLDDVWNEDREKWDDFVISLSKISSATGNCMIVTTRSEVDASIVETLSVHKVKGLSEDDCWSIIKAKAFGPRDNPIQFETIGKKIAKKCKGSSFAAKVVGGLLLCKKSINEWLEIEKNLHSDYGDESRVMISKILKLSFDHLPSPSLKKCFACCSIFPKGHVMEKKQLVDLWMAEGFLQTEHCDSISSKFFKILLQKSFLQVARTNEYGNVTHCYMHDLVHDISCSILCQRRYIGWKPRGGRSLSIPQGQERYVRTLFFNGKVSDIRFSDFESLHSLTLMDRDINELPTSIRELKHLRYLDISETSITVLPDSICELYHLQTFRAKGNYLRKLQDSFIYLISLRHLDIAHHTTLPPQIGKLTFLQTLPHFRVRNEKGCGVSELGNLKDLKRYLKISNLENVCDKIEATRADLLRKPGIYNLRFAWDESREGRGENDESVLEGLEPHPNLKEIEICGFKGKSLPQWTSKMAVQLDGQNWEGLNNLMEIYLTDFSECEELPMLGHLPHLKSLYLHGLTNVKSIRPSFYGNTDNSMNGVCKVFRALERLDLSDMTNLSEWADVALPLESEGDQMQEYYEMMVFPRLQYLTLRRCKQLMRAPSHFPCLGELTITEMESSLPLENICGMKLTTLTCLSIWGIKGLECLPDGLFSNNQNLSKLNISDCPKMTHLVPFLRGGRAPSLRELHIYKCPVLKSIPYSSSSGGGFTSLRKLHIHGCNGLNIFPIEMVESCAPSLESLELSGLSSVTNFPMVVGYLHKMTSLRFVRFNEVPKFSIHDTGSLSTTRSLQCLLMGPTSDLDSSNVSFNESVSAMLQSSQFISLHSLSLYGMEHWECLPDEMQHLTSLKGLLLSDFGIEALPEWFRNLASLEDVQLVGCQKLTTLPSKQAMQRLTKLNRFEIQNCPLLLKEETRCNIESGHDVGNDEHPPIVDSEWPKISHIPTIYVDFDRFTSHRCGH